jgi:16S rRNA (cytidine1402-2'-O)-methyltransferase
MGTLVIIGTPIGNLDDLSPRAQRTLGQLDALACEDTRVTRKIFERYDIHSPRTIFSYHEHNEEMGGKRMLGLLAQGLAVGLCSDGGMPGVSDPGYRVITAALDAGHNIEVIPGPSAVLTALVLSGLSTASFTFKGFPPRKSGQRQKWFEQEKHLPHTLIVFDSPFRIVPLLEDALTALGDRPGAVCIELTKKFERVHRGRLSELIQELDGKGLQGEATVVIAGADRKQKMEERAKNRERRSKHHRDEEE